MRPYLLRQQFTITSNYAGGSGGDGHKQLKTDHDDGGDVLDAPAVKSAIEKFGRSAEYKEVVASVLSACLTEAKAPDSLPTNSKNGDDRGFCEHNNLNLL
jgi:hypothetical protein